MNVEISRSVIKVSQIKAPNKSRTKAVVKLTRRNCKAFFFLVKNNQEIISNCLETITENISEK